MSYIFSSYEALLILVIKYINMFCQKILINLNLNFWYLKLFLYFVSYETIKLILYYKCETLNLLYFVLKLQ
jgi:hypothetical protein